MPEWKSLPVEILFNIFQRLDKKDNGQSSLTCRAWNSVVQPILFEHIDRFNDSDVHNLAAILSNRRLGSLPGDFVKIINTQNLSGGFDVALLDKLFPFLQSIDIRLNQQTLYDQLYRLIMEGRFSNLKKMPFIKLDEVYLKLLIARKEQIKDLKLPGWPYRYSEKAINELFENLNLFSKLNKIQLHLSSGKVIVYLEKLLAKNTPALEIINFGSSVPSEFILPMNSSNVQVLPNVREVRISSFGLLSNGDEAYLYFMKKFPNLRMLNISSTYRGAYTHNYKKPTFECLSAFFSYILNFKKGCSVSPIVTDHNTESVAENFFKQALDERTGTLKSKEIKLQIIFSAEPDCKAYIKPDIKSRGNKKLLELKVVYQISSDNFSLPPYLELFQRVGNMNVEHLWIENVDSNLLPPETLSISFDTILDYFLHLKKLCLFQIHNITFSSSEDKLGSNLEFLQFETCEIDQKLFTKISDRCLNLKWLEIDSSSHFMEHDTGLNAHVICQNVLICMPSTRLQELRFYVSLRTEFGNHQYQRVFIRLKTANKKPRYCKLIWTPPPPLKNVSSYSTEFDTREDGCSEEDFKTSLKDGECMVYDIYCKAVLKFTINTDTACYSNKELKTKIYMQED